MNTLLSIFLGKGYDAMINYLSDTAYIGKYKLYRKNLYVDNYTPRILDDDIWKTVQGLRKRKERNNPKSIQSSLFSGIMYCNTCNCRMTKKQDNRCKTIVMRYVCDNASRKKVRKS